MIVNTFGLGAPTLKSIIKVTWKHFDFFVNSIRYPVNKSLDKARQKAAKKISSKLLPVNKYSGRANHVNKTPPKILILVFSKDRAMQLDGLLQSLSRHCSDYSFVDKKVLYTTSKITYKKQYDILKNIYAEIDFVEEYDYKQQVLSLIKPYNYVLFLVDDALVTNTFHINSIISHLHQHQDAVGFSLRLGENIKSCYMINKLQKMPSPIFHDNSLVKYDWTQALCDFGYPLELSSTVYRVQDLYHLLLNSDYYNPNTMEVSLYHKRHKLKSSLKYMLCYRTSLMFCNPINKVQQTHDNRAGEKIYYAIEQLAELFDKGLRIDVSCFDHFIPTSCHQEAALQFIHQNH